MEIFANPRYQEVVIHDLRTPLNVISLALRMLDGAAASRAPELAEDLAMIRSNAAELERMLVYLVDLSRLPQSPEALSAEPIEPRRLIDEVVHEHRSKSGGVPVQVEINGVPDQVRLDPMRARMALQKALANASAASGGKPVRIRAGGGADRLRIEIEVPVPPRESVRSHDIDPDGFQRIVGTPAERRGIDLAIVARISALFGGTARLEATPGERTVVVLDWPTAPAAN